MKKTIYSFLAIVMLIFAVSENSQAGSLLISNQGMSGSYGGAGWARMTGYLDAAASSLDIVPTFDNLAEMMTYDALWLDVRGMPGSLGATEQSNIAAFFATGRRVVIMGEGDSWIPWNNEILGMVGGSYDTNSSGVLTPIVANEITNGISTLDLPNYGMAIGGTALFNQNFATLWGTGDNVLTILDINALGNYNRGDSDQFSQNVANWVVSGATVVPEPLSLLLYGAGLLGIAGLRKKKKE